MTKNYKNNRRHYSLLEMGEFHNSDAFFKLIEPKNEVRGSITGPWSEEHDRLPLKLRLKILLARRSFSELFPDENSEKDETCDLSAVANECFVGKEDEQCGLEGFPSASFVGKGVVGIWSYEQNHTGEQGGCNDRVIEANKVSMDMVPAENSMSCSSLQKSLLSSGVMSTNVSSADNSSSNAFGSPANYSIGCGLQDIKIKNESPSDIFDELDHVALKERQRMLLSREILGLTKTSLEVNTIQLSSPPVDDLSKQSAGIVKEEMCYGDKEFQSVENYVSEMQKTSISSSSIGGVKTLPCTDLQSSELCCQNLGLKSVKSGNMISTEDKDRASAWEKIFSKSGANSGQNLLSGKSTVHNLVVSKFVHVKVEPFDNNEPSFEKVSVGHLSLANMHPMESEPYIPDDSYEDKLDHMLLRERMNLLSAQVPKLDVYGTECLGKMIPSGTDFQPIAQESAKPLRINRPRKRRKTATDSVETALEEDAPGLLQILIQKGVSVFEIKLYGETESDEALEDSSTEDNFSELEAIISKLFSQRNSLLKLAPLRCSKGERASYCLACLFSLVEQARYLQCRKWPVEWGWCRDLQAFIFVFERHNRIVLERPEYGYATYFFELMDCLPIDWQIKRLVTAMKLTSCSRITLIENKALVVGEDLTEGEARVLMEYGWIPNTGLGSMLNYRDRVVHDRKCEDTSEWRSKIGKLLIDGYNGGCIVSSVVPKKVAEYNFAHSPQVKLETS